VTRSHHPQDFRRDDWDVAAGIAEMLQSVAREITDQGDIAGGWGHDQRHKVELLTQAIHVQLARLDEATKQARAELAYIDYGARLSAYRRRRKAIEEAAAS
jgi:hypothetical protein